MNIQYVVYCEDEAQKKFLHSIVPFLIKNLEPNYNVETDIYFDKKFGSSKSVDKVKKTFIEASFYAFRNYKTNLFILSFDADCFEDKDIKNKREEWISLIKKQNPSYENKFILAIPVQAIEYWLLYLQSIKKEPTKLRAGLFEKIPRKGKDGIKVKIYGTEKYISRTCDPIVSELVTGVSSENINLLRSNSSSFNRFYFDLEAFLIKSKQ